MNFISYARNFEDVMLSRAFRDVASGFYVDARAGDPLCGSVTKHFYDAGWTGINCESREKFYQMLRASRARDINWKMALGDVAESGGLDAMLDEHKIRVVHFLRLEADEMNPQALAGLALKVGRPWIILVQATRQDSSEAAPFAADVLSHLKANRYEPIYFDGANFFLIAEEHNERRGAFATPLNASDHFIPYRHLQILKPALNRALLYDILGSPEDPEELIAATLKQERDANLEAAKRAKDLERKFEEYFYLTIKREAEIRSMRSSLSWKLTAPLRRLSDRISEIRRRHAPQRGAAPAEGTGFSWARDYPLARASFPIAFDVSSLHQKDIGTGVQRVVRNIVTSLLQEKGQQIAAVNLRNEAVHDVSQVFLQPGAESLTGPTRITQMDKLVMLDGSWDIYPNLSPLFQSCRRTGVEIVTCVFDLIPIDFPETCQARMPGIFKAWLDEAIRQTDAFVCISEDTARRLEAYVRADQDRAKKHLKIGWWHLGTNISHRANRGVPAIDMRIIDRPYVLLVGTLEPRKNHAFVLEAFEKLWADPAFPYGLVFAGKSGWNSDELECKILSSSHLGDRLVWKDDTSDAELDILYRNCSACVVPSITEGFGLPVVEAASFSKPVVLSDIPVFHEIVREDGYFFEPGSQESFRAALERALSSEARPTKTLQTTWSESANALLAVITADRYQIRL